MRGRIFFSVPLESSRFLSFGNATIAEKDHNRILNDFYLLIDLKFSFQEIFDRGVETAILWDIIKQNIIPNDSSFFMPKPPLQNIREVEK